MYLLTCAVVQSSPTSRYIKQDDSSPCNTRYLFSTHGRMVECQQPADRGFEHLMPQVISHWLLKSFCYHSSYSPVKYIPVYESSRYLVVSILSDMSTGWVTPDLVCSYTKADEASYTVQCHNNIIRLWYNKHNTITRYQSFKYDLSSYCPVLG